MDVLLLMLFAYDVLGSTEFGGLDFAGDATLGSGPELPEDPDTAWIDLEVLPFSKSGDVL